LLNSIPCFLLYDDGIHIPRPFQRLSRKKSIGGGYYLRHDGYGIVIDPGYNFLQNFYEAGGRIFDIDAIVLTHAHNDHTMSWKQY
jgi:glyoxylase-like metal-dependent hydrolase (beta-lactamase superfamily II)